MIKAAIFSDSLDASSNNPTGHYVQFLAESLAQQSVSVTVVGSEPKGLAIDFMASNSLQVVYPFKKWSLLELPMAVPMLMQLKPDILHVFQPQKKHSFFSCYPLLFDLFDITYRPAKILSVINQHWNSQALEVLLRRCDQVTVQFPHMLNDWPHEDPQELSKIRYVPMLNRTNTNLKPAKENSIENSKIDLQISETTKVIFIPAEVSQMLAVEKTLSTIIEALKLNSQLEFVFNGGWGEIRPRKRGLFWKQAKLAGVASRVRLLEYPFQFQNLNVEPEQLYYWLSPINPMKCDIGHCLEWCFEAKATALVDPQHYSHPHRKIKSRWIECSNNARDLLEILTAANRRENTMHGEKNDQSLSEDMHDHALADHPANIISRMYHQVLSEVSLRR